MAPPRLSRCLGILALSAALTLVVSGVSLAAGMSRRIAGTQPGWAVQSNAAGEARGSATVVFSLWLGWRHQEELDSLLAAQQDPASPRYQQWLAPKRFRQRFAPDTASVRAVSEWLRRQRFQIVDVPRNRLFVTAVGTVAQVERAFQVD